MRNDPGRFQVESMRMSAESKLRGQHPGIPNRGPSVKSLLFKLGALILIIVLIFVWVYSE